MPPHCNNVSKLSPSTPLKQYFRMGVCKAMNKDRFDASGHDSLASFAKSLFLVTPKERRGMEKPQQGCSGFIIGSINPTLDVFVVTEFDNQTVALHRFHVGGTNDQSEKAAQTKHDQKVPRDT